MRIATAVLAGCLGLVACRAAPEGTHAEVPARVEHPQPETALTTITLTPAAVTRLGIDTAPVEQRRLPRRRVVGGEIVVPVSTAGVERPTDIVAPAADRARAPEAMIAASEAVAAARAHVEAATTAFRRAERVLAEGAGSARAVDEARLQLALARTTLAAAESRYELAATVALGSSDVVWVRVPVYVGDVPAIARDEVAHIGSLGQDPKVAPRDARPVAAPATANADLATADLYYELDNRDHGLRPGEKVAVSLALHTEGDTLTVPWAAVLHDVHGGEWVYQALASESFARRRIQVRYVVDGTALLASGPAAGVRVVVAGAAELFGTEFGVGH